MKLTNQQVADMSIVLGKLRDMSLPVKAAYAVIKNLRTLKPHYDTIIELNKPSKEQEELEKARIALCQECATKDDDGKPMTTINALNGQQEFVIKDMNEFNKALEELYKEHEDAVTTKNEQAKQIEAMLEEECEYDFKLLTIPMDVLPDNVTLSGRELEAIMSILSD